MQTRYVNTASTAGGDGTTNSTSGATRAFATLREALDSLPSTLSDAYTIYCEGSAADTGNVDQSPWDFTTTATNYLLITTTAANRHSGKWDTNKYRITATNRNGLYQNSSCHVRIDGIQVQVTVSNASSYVCFKSSNANQTASDCYLTISNCIAKAVMTSGQVTGFHWRPFTGGGGTVAFANNIAFDCNQGYEGDKAVNIYNCGAYDCTYGFVDDHGSNIAINCLAHGCTIGFVGTWGGSGTSYNAEDDGNGVPGTNGRSATTFTFVNAASDDFHLASTDAGARNFGTDLSGDATFPFSTDIDGETRSGTWDIGPDEYVQAEAPAGSSAYQAIQQPIMLGFAR